MRNSDHPIARLMEWNKQNHLQYLQQYVTDHRISCVKDIPPIFYTLSYTARHQRENGQRDICVEMQPD